MKNKNIFGLLGIVSLGLLLCSSCQPPVTPEQAQKAVEAAGKIVVPLDSVHGEASTTKNFYFLFDCSGSMDERCDRRQKIDGAKEAAIQFLSKIPEGVNIGLLLFGVNEGRDNNGCKEVLPLTFNGKDAFKKAVDAIEPTGNTPLGEAINIGTEKLVQQYKKQLGYGEYRLIVVTDGMANGNVSLSDACVNMARYEFIALYSIGLCLDREHDLKSFALAYRDASNFKDLEKALEESVAETPSFDGAAYDSTAYTAEKKVN